MKINSFLKNQSLIFADFGYLSDFNQQLVIKPNVSSFNSSFAAPKICCRQAIMQTPKSLNGFDSRHSVNFKTVQTTFANQN